jgi:hypothetical protein
MARPAMNLAPKTGEFRSIDIAWLRRKGAREVAGAGQITWSSQGEVTSSVGYEAVYGGLRPQPQGGVPRPGLQQTGQSQQVWRDPKGSPRASDLAQFV